MIQITTSTVHVGVRRLARKAGVSPATVSRVLNGRQKPGKRVELALAKFGVVPGGMGAAKQTVHRGVRRLAKELGCRHPYVSRVFSGKQLASAELMRNLLDIGIVIPEASIPKNYNGAMYRKDIAENKPRLGRIKTKAERMQEANKVFAQMGKMFGTETPPAKNKRTA